MKWDPQQYDARHHYVWDHGASLLSLLDAKPGERILDFGCGTGHLTNEIAATGADVTGIDRSPDMIEQARRNYPELRFELADGLKYRAEKPFDAVFSNAVLHWMRPPEAAAESIAAAVKPGGRVVLEFGAKGNTRSVTDLIGEHPWYYPTIGEYTSLLERYGIEAVTAIVFPRPTAVDGETGLRDWLKMFTSTFLSEDRVPAIENALRPKLYRDGAWHIDYVRLRITARKLTATGV